VQDMYIIILQRIAHFAGAAGGPITEGSEHRRRCWGAAYQLARREAVSGALHGGLRRSLAAAFAQPLSSDSGFSSKGLRQGCGSIERTG
jgi:hypothetical protein